MCDVDSLNGELDALGVPRAYALQPADKAAQFPAPPSQPTPMPTPSPTPIQSPQPTSLPVKPNLVRFHRFPSFSCSTEFSVREPFLTLTRCATLHMTAAGNGCAHGIAIVVARHRVGCACSRHTGNMPILFPSCRAACWVRSRCPFYLSDK
jgi:hypothetical protein